MGAPILRLLFHNAYRLIGAVERIQGAFRSHKSIARHHDQQRRQSGSRRFQGADLSDGHYRGGPRQQAANHVRRSRDADVRKQPDRRHDPTRHRSERREEQDFSGSLARLPVDIGQFGQHRHGLRSQVDRSKKQQRGGGSDGQRKRQAEVQALFEQHRFERKPERSVEHCGGEQIPGERGLGLRQVPAGGERASAPIRRRSGRRAPRPASHR